MRDVGNIHSDSMHPAQRSGESVSLRSLLDALRIEDREECCRDLCSCCAAGLAVTRDDLGIPTWHHGTSICRAQMIREMEHKRKSRRDKTDADNCTKSLAPRARMADEISVDGAAV